MLPEPLTRRQAMSGPEEEQWLEAEQSELKSMINNKVFGECLLPKGRKAIRSKWIYKRKRDKEGDVEKYKV